MTSSAPPPPGLPDGPVPAPRDPAPRDPDGEPLHRYALTLQYRGDPFHGWQRQRDHPTVQSEIERVLLRLTGAPRTVLGSGRTDAGVHATGQVAGVQVPEKWRAATLRSAMNALLPRAIWVEEVRRVPRAFHPRYDATLRTYEYRVGTASDAASPFHRDTCWPLEPDELPDPSLLDRAAEGIPGERSFRRFAKTGQPSRGERCRVDRAAWARVPGFGFRFRIAADRYLHHMVRYLVGTMMDVARGRRPLEEMAVLLNDPDTPLRTSPPAPPEGLFLARVDYPSELWSLPPDCDPPVAPGSPRTIDPYADAEPEPGAPHE